MKAKEKTIGELFALPGQERKRLIRKAVKQAVLQYRETFKKLAKE